MLKFIRFPFLFAVSYLLLAIGFSSCSTFDPPLVVPIYGHIDSIHFSVPFDSAALQGTASSKITYAWVYVDDNPVGVFQMPCTFPMVVGNGTHSIEVFPGVNPIGETSPAGIYPFYKAYTTTVNLQQGTLCKIKPTSVYYPWVKFMYKESFTESPGSQPTGIINYDGSGNTSAASTTKMVVINNPTQGFDGGNAGMVTVDVKHNYYIGMTTAEELDDSNGTSVFMELNYKATAPFTIGMFEGDTTDQISPIAVIFPAATWTKLYVNLNTTMASFPIQPYRVYFAMPLPTADTVDQLYLANIKIME